MSICNSEQKAFSSLHRSSLRPKLSRRVAAYESMPTINSMVIPLIVFLLDV
jgi:hypothetical protein